MCSSGIHLSIVHMTTHKMTWHSQQTSKSIVSGLQTLRQTAIITAFSGVSDAQTLGRGTDLLGVSMHTTCADCSPALPVIRLCWPLWMTTAAQLPSVLRPGGLRCCSLTPTESALCKGKLTYCGCVQPAQGQLDDQCAINVKHRSSSDTSVMMPLHETQNDTHSINHIQKSTHMCKCTISTHLCKLCI